MSMDIKPFAISFDNIINQLKLQEKKMLVTTHRYLDGDAFGSALALGLILRKCHMDSTLICVPFIPDKFQFLKHQSGLDIIEPRHIGQEDHQGLFTRSLQDYFSETIKDYGALAVLDCAGFNQIPKEVWAISHQFPFMINIDHHMGYTLDHLENRILNLVEDRSSTCEVLFELMDAMEIEMDQEIALPLYMGLNADLRKNAISKDSSQYPKSIVHALNQRIKQMDKGIQEQIKDIFSLDPWEKRLLEIAIQKIRFSGNIAYATFDPKMVLKAKRETDSLDNPRMPFHEFHIRLRQKLDQFKDKVQIVVIFDQILGKVSLYALQHKNSIDLAAISEELGDGGGHSNRAGFSFQTAREKLTAAALIGANDTENTVIEAMIRFIRNRISQIPGVAPF